jgi:hypothetical protein
MRHNTTTTTPLVLAEAAAIQDMATRVLNNGGEPHYTVEKLSVAFRATVRTLLALGCTADELTASITRQAQR